LWHLRGYPVRMILFRIMRNGFGGITTPVAAMTSTLWDLSDYSVKHSTLHGLKTMGQRAVATDWVSSLRNLQYLYFSVFEPGFVSRLKMGSSVTLLNPQLNYIFCLEGMASLFSKVLLILKCMVDSLHSWGNSVDNITASFILKYLLWSDPEAISRTMVM
jgi:hypothetical protein